MSQLSPMEKVIPDPVLSAFELPLRRVFYPYGFPLELETNSADVIAAAAEGWEAFEQAFEEPPVRFCLGVSEGGAEALPVESVVRSREHMMSIIADPENFVICDFNRGFAFGWVTQNTAADHPLLRYRFLTSGAATLIDQRALAVLHGALVVRNGSGVMLTGDSFAGKSTLAYACARRGWTYVSDDGAFLVRGRDDRYVIGDPHSIRFRPDAPELFPELVDRVVTIRPNGKVAIEVLTRDLPLNTAPGLSCRSCCVSKSREAVPARASLVQLSVKNGFWSWLGSLLRVRNAGSARSAAALSGAHAQRSALGNAVLRSRRRGGAAGAPRRFRYLIYHASTPLLPRLPSYSSRCGIPSFSQVSSGSLLGDARDEKAAAVPAVVIVARGIDTGFTRSTATNAFGSYRIDDLLPGAYTVIAQHDGFQAVTVSPVFVEVNQKVRLDVELQVGSVHETATVNAHASALQTDEASEGYTLGSNFFEELPLLGRNIVDLVTLGPGAIPRQLGGFTHDQINDLQGNRGTVSFNAPVNGARSTENSYILDGADNTDRNTFSIAVMPLMESVAEFRIQSALAPAEFAQSGGGVIDVVTKPGSQTFHGNIFEFFRNEATDAASFFAVPGLPRGDLPPKPIWRDFEWTDCEGDLLLCLLRRVALTLVQFNPASGSQRGCSWRRFLVGRTDLQSTDPEREWRARPVSEQRHPFQSYRSHSSEVSRAV